jgi:hypothetical protein
VGSCLDALNAPFIKTNQAPRLMTPNQANACMAALREATVNLCPGCSLDLAVEKNGSRT